MKILKPGTNKRPALRGTCLVCGCEVETEKHEARYVEERPGDGAYCVKCPECKHDFLWVK